MRARSAVVALALASLAGGVTPASAADEPLALSADTGETGWIGFHVRGRSGTTAVVSERVGSRSTPVASIPLGSGAAASPRALRWRCDRLVRRFVATAPGPFGTQESSEAEVQTPSCRKRLGASVRRRRVPAGGRAIVRLRDRWRVGGTHVSLCSRPPAGRRSCRKLQIPAGSSSAAARVHVSRPGRWIVEARVAGGRLLRRRLSVRPRGGRLRVLATGDSMIQVVDGFIEQRLNGRVRSDARVSTGISKPGMFDWVRHAHRQATRRPDVTVMFIGANEGFPIGGAACCGGAWVRRYAGRVRRMMEAYRRGRAGVVYWLTLPTPRDARFARVFGPVNRALRRAASSFRQQVRLIDLRRVFTPDGRFQRVIRYRGRRVVARQDDGVHLSTAGASIAAEVVIRALRRDRIR